MFTITSKTFSSGLPGKIKVGPITYQIILESNPKADHQGDQIPVFGMVNFKKAVITIDQDLPPVLQWQCLFHEFIHILYETLGLEDPGEGQDDAIAYLLMDFMLDNGFLLEEDPAALELPALESQAITRRSAALPFPCMMEKKE